MVVTKSPPSPCLIKTKLFVYITDRVLMRTRSLALIRQRLGALFDYHVSDHVLLNVISGCNCNVYTVVLEMFNNYFMLIFEYSRVTLIFIEVLTLKK